MMYDTHLPVLEFLFQNFKIESVLELGVGEASSPFLAQRARVVSVEADIGWYQKFKATHLCSALDFACRNTDRYDLVFVDSNPASERSECVRLMLPLATFVVAHDTEPESEWNYGYSKIELPDGFVRLDYTKATPWTSIFTQKTEIISKWSDL